jgi:hypothetical protein
VQRDAASELHVEVAHIDRAFARFTHHRERLGQQFIDRFSAVLAFSASSDSFAIAGSSALIARTECMYCRSSRSLRLPKIFLSRPVIMNRFKGDSPK